MPVKFKVIVPRPVNSKAMLQAYVEAMKDTTDEAEKRFKKTVRTWDEEPKFDKKVETFPDKIIGTVATDDEKYGYVSRGTRVRYATMTPDFEAKTQPGLIDSRLGSGGVAYVDRRRPRPGIKARRFEEEIAKEIEPVLKEKAEKASEVGAKASGHSI